MHKAAAPARLMPVSSSMQSALEGWHSGSSLRFTPILFPKGQRIGSLAEIPLASHFAGDKFNSLKSP